MVQPDTRVSHLEAARTTSLGRVMVTLQMWADSIDIVSEPREHLLQFQLAPRLPHSHDSRACFSHHWKSTRFEPIGTAFLLPASEQIHLRSNCRRASNITCMFPPRAIQTWFEDELRWTDERLKHSLDIPDPTLRTLLFRLSEEIRNPGFATEALIELLYAEIVIALARYSMGAEERRGSGGLAPWRLRLIDERLRDTGPRPSLGELALLCKLSPRQLTRAFRISRGCSIGDYIASSRIEEARRLLGTEMNVKSIAHELGFSSPSHFYMAFHRATGETPREYRQRMGGRAAALS